MHEITITGLDGSAAQLWYQLSLYDGPDFLNKTEWINGGAAKERSSKQELQEFPAAAVVGGVGAFLLLLCLAVIILLVFRLRKEKAAKENKVLNKINGSDMPMHCLPHASEASTCSSTRPVIYSSDNAYDQIEDNSAQHMPSAYEDVEITNVSEGPLVTRAAHYEPLHSYLNQSQLKSAEYEKLDKSSCF